MKGNLRSKGVLGPGDKRVDELLVMIEGKSKFCFSYIKLR